ncbi:MAG: hypothetical protein N838_04155 [Thiohalocapsa sp. PB-PSB1]|nr:MAG: hypothetical protein N838_04155 [Thiohalocapsa sp. PB-PSB1]
MPATPKLELSRDNNTANEFGRITLDKGRDQDRANRDRH